VTTEFWIILPEVVSNLAIALSVAEAGPTTSPPKLGLVLVTVKLGYVPDTLMPVPLAIATVWSGAVLVTVTAPVPLDTDIPVPATAEVTPVLVTVKLGICTASANTCT
jgi:hypothetical protein